MREEAKNFLQFVPVKEPRSDSVTVLAHDKEISGFDSSKFVFTDITFDATDQVCQYLTDLSVFTKSFTHCLKYTV